jgi:hypothetical protein
LCHGTTSHVADLSRQVDITSDLARCDVFAYHELSLLLL